MSPALQKNNHFHVQKLWPYCHFVKWPPKNRVLFWGWNVKIWWPVHRKTIKPMEMRRKSYEIHCKTHRIHKHPKGNAATFNYPPGGTIEDGCWSSYRITTSWRVLLRNRYLLVCTLKNGFLELAAAFSWNWFAPSWLLENKYYQSTSTVKSSFALRQEEDTEEPQIIITPIVVPPEKAHLWSSRRDSEFRS